MSYTITAVGSELKVDDGGATPDFYPFSQVRIEPNNTDAKIAIYFMGNEVYNIALADIASPSGVNAEAVADAIAELMVQSVSASVEGTITIEEEDASSAAISNISASQTSQQLIAANPNRKSLWLYNNSSSIAYVKFGTTAASNSFTFPAAAFTGYTIEGKEYSGRVDAIWVTATGSMQITETSE